MDGNERKMTVEEVIEALGLIPLEEEGGLVKETYRSSVLTESGEAAGTAIERLADATAELIDRVLKPGLMDGMYFSVSCYNRDVAPETYRKYIMPAEKRIIAEATPCLRWLSSTQNSSMSRKSLSYIKGFSGLQI